MDGKTKAIVAHLTLVGWIIALVLNSSEKDDFASFYIRQNLGIILIGVAAGIIVVIPILGWLASMVLWIYALVCWIISIIGAIQGEIKEVPILGDKFQEWFKAI